MTATTLLSDPRTARAYVDFLVPPPAADGLEPESRIVHCGMSWERYLAFDKALGDDRPGPRFYYLDGDLEIMTTSGEHERIKKWLGGFFDLYFDEVGIEITQRGQATMRDALEEAGAEPDESWCLHEEKTYPDIVLEIALTSGGIRKLDLYQRFPVPEGWIWRRDKLEIFTLREDGSGYEPVASGRSLLLPGLDIGLLERCVAIRSWRGARLAFRAGLEAGK